MSGVPEANPRVLVVDDEQRVLDGIRRHLRKDFDLTLACGSMKALEIVEEQGAFEVIVSDLQMPEMDGITMLAKLRETAPEMTRILLTGNAELKVAIDAVNQGNLFRFLTKPCPAEDLATAIRAGAEHHRLVTSERVLLEETLLGSVAMLSDVLSLSQPEAFGRATRLRKLASEMATALELRDGWQLELTVVLSQIGFVILPDTVVRKLNDGKELATDEEATVRRVPEFTSQLVGHIPRLEEVQEALRCQGKHFDGSGTPVECAGGESIPLGARVLRLLLDNDELQVRGSSPAAAIQQLRERTGWYDPDLLRLLAEIQLAAHAAHTEALVSLKELREGMVLLDACRSESDMLLVAHGTEVTRSMIERLGNCQENMGVRQPIRVRVPGCLEAEAAG